MNTNKQKILYLIIFFILKFYSCYPQTEDQKSKSVFQMDELNQFFKLFLNHIENHKSISNQTIGLVSLIVEPNEIKWQSEIIETEMTIASESRDMMNRIYQKDLGDLFEDYLKNNEWNVKHLTSDHWGEYEYRIMVGAEKEDNEFQYVYTATNLRNGDWNGKIHILSDNESYYGSIDCDYDSFFGQVTSYLEGRTKSVDEINNCLIVNFYDNPIDYKLDKKKYKIRMSFYCQFGPSSTPDGYSCYDLLSSYFKSFLEKNGYSVAFKETHSETGWIKHIWAADKKKSSFLFIYESESSLTSGYSKIHVVDK